MSQMIMENSIGNTSKLNRSESMLGRIVKSRSFAMLGALVFIWILFAVLTEGTFLSVRNFSNLFRLTGIKGILVIGMVGCLVSGVFDLSIGSVVGLTGALSAILQMNMGINWVVSLILSLVVGLIIGIWQGYWIAYREVPAFIVTLGGMMIFRGFTILITRGSSIPVNTPGFEFLGQNYLPKWISIALGILFIVGSIYFQRYRQAKRKEYGLELKKSWEINAVLFIMIVLTSIFILGLNSYQGIPISVVLLIMLYYIFNFIYNKTKYGRYVYAVGGNLEAARLSGIDIKRMYMKIFIIMGVLSALTGNVLTSRLASATPNAGDSFELDTIASCVIGGISLAGGKGALFGAIVGTLVMTSLGNGMSLMNMTAAWQDVIKGLILIFAVWFDVYSNKKK